MSQVFAPPSDVPYASIEKVWRVRLILLTFFDSAKTHQDMTGTEHGKDRFT
jgi:hypothetical protein